MTLFNLDIHTIITLLFTGNLVALVILIAFGSNKAPERPYMHFMLGKLLQTLAWPLLGMRGNIPDVFSVYIGNTLLICGFALETFSLTVVNVPERRWKTVYGVLSITSIAAFWVFAGTPNMRVVMASAATSVLYITASVALIFMSGGSRLRISLGILCGVFSIILAFRSGIALFMSGEFGLMTRNLIQTISFQVLFLLVLVSGIGFLLMLKERDDRLLSESEEKYRTLVEKADEAIVIVQDRNFVFANKRMSDLLGIPNDTLMGIPVTDLIHPEDRDMVIMNYEKRLRGENLHNVYDFRLIGQEGRQVWVSNSSTKIQWKGRPASLSLLTDINYRKNMEEERERIISELQIALADVKTLSGLLPICSSCKKIRDDKGYWSQIEVYIKNHSDADFSHGLCPDCVEKLYPGMYKKIQPGETVK
jgi:PAS domain S-box-containing protein